MNSALVILFCINVFIIPSGLIILCYKNRVITYIQALTYTILIALCVVPTIYLYDSKPMDIHYVFVQSVTGQETQPEDKSPSQYRTKYEDQKCFSSSCTSTISKYSK